MAIADSSQTLTAAVANAASAASLTSGDVLGALLLAGLLGMIGQSVRAIVGLKKMTDTAAVSATSARDLFIASRLVTSQIIGFIAGVIAGLSLGVGKILNISDPQLLVGIAAAGYAGTDIIEGFARRLGGSTSTGSGGGSSSTTGQTTGSGGLATGGLRTQLARNLLEAYQAARGEGLSDVAARALVANMTGEALHKPADYHWDVSHYAQGIVQWDPSRAKCISDHFGCEPRKMSVAQQTQAAIWEIRTNARFARTRIAIEQGTNAAEIIDALVRNYEVPAHPDQQVARRVSYLQSLSRVIDKRAIA